MQCMQLHGIRRNEDGRIREGEDSAVSFRYAAAEATCCLPKFVHWYRSAKNELVTFQELEAARACSGWKDPLSTGDRTVGISNLSLGYRRGSRVIENVVF